MQLNEALRTGAAEIAGHKTRSFLSFIAIAIGVASFMFTFVTIYNLNKRMRDSFELTGYGRMTIRRDWDKESVSGRPDKLTMEDFSAIQKTFPKLPYLCPDESSNPRFLHKIKTIKGASVAGVTADWAKRGWVYKLKGRFINDYDVDNYLRVAVVMEDGGWAGKKPWWATFWSRKDGVNNYAARNHLLGESIRLDDHLYTVVGVLTPPPHDRDPRWFRWNSEPDVLIPITSYMRYLSLSPGVLDQIDLDTGSEASVPDVKAKLEQLLKARHGGEQFFRIQDFKEMMNNTISEIKKYALTVMTIGIVAILAGGIGIMNVMLATIFSRIKEIGIRRAIGATQTDIMLQFIIEAMLLGLLGGVVGIGLGYLGVHYLGDDEERARNIIAWWMPFASVFIAIAAGFLFSLYPAWRASRMDPVEALRYE